MSAIEMFKELGYEYSTLLSDQQRIYYEHKNENQPSNFIIFDLDYQIISNDNEITLQELQAINKQIEELFEVTTDKKAKDDLLEILERVNEE